MLADVRTPPLSAAIGRLLRQLRHEKGARQDELARAARASGLSWTAGSVTALETGRRSLTIDEVVKLPLALHRLGVPAAGATRTSPAPPLAILGDADEAVFRLCGLPLMQQTGFRWEKSLQQVAASERVVKTLPGVSKQEIATARDDEDGLLEQRIARRFKVDPLSVAVMARRRWGRSVTEERDYRSASTTAGASRRAAQTIRGHATRDLMADLEQDLEPFRRHARKLLSTGRDSPRRRT
jgi:transcriptional regulator with XRE-family HTH domain